MTKSNVIGLIGTALLAVAAMLGRMLKYIPANLAVAFLGMTLGAAVLGAIAATTGRKWWFIETALGVLMAAIVLFGLVGP